MRLVTIAAGIFLIAVGAIIRYALNLRIAGVEEPTLGLILIIAGIAGIVLSLLQDALWADRARRRDRSYDDRTRPLDDRY
jgi:uncharacterized protein involved in exopolysaccharide biosynthesis